MHCQYCGKEIGALRLLRDSEFCSASHRKNYKDRLGKVLTQIHEAPEPTPRQTGFLVNYLPYPGNVASAMELWQTGGCEYRTILPIVWPVALDTSTDTQPPAAVPKREEIPAASKAWMRAPGADPVESWIVPSIATQHLAAPPRRTYPALAVAAAVQKAAPALSIGWADVPPAEPVAACVQPAVASQLTCTRTPADLPLTFGISGGASPAVFCGWAETPQAEPAARWIDIPALQPETSGVRMVLPATVALATRQRDLCTTAKVPAAEPVAAFVTSSVASQIESTRVIASPAFLLQPLADELAADTQLAGPAAAPSAEPAASWIETSICAEPIRATALALPSPDGLAIPEPVLVAAFSPIPVAEPVAAFLTVSVAEQFDCTISSVAPAFSLELLTGVENAPTTDTADWIAIPQAEPAARWIKPSTAAASVREIPATLPSIDSFELSTHLDSPGLRETRTPAPVTAPPRTAAASRVDRSIAAAGPNFQIKAELDPLAALGGPPALCEAWAMVPQAEPVWSELQSAVAAASLASIEQAVPVLPLSVSRPYVPSPIAWRRTPSPEPVMAGVWPRIAETPLQNIGEPMHVYLPEFRRRTERTGPAARGPMPSLEPQAVATLVTAASAGPALGTPSVRLQPFLLAKDEVRRAAAVDQPRIAASAAEPAPACGTARKPNPIPTIRIITPEPTAVHHAAGIPRAGAISIEYHIQRKRGAPIGRPEWKSCCFQPLAPRFTLRPVLEKLDDVLKPKVQPTGIFRMPEPRPTRSVLMKHAPRVAAAVVAATSMWLAVSAVKSSRRIAIPEADSSFAMSGRVITADSQKPAEPKGSMGRFRRAIANRATLQLTDDFRHGMKSWSTDGSLYPAGWQSHPDGYVQTGALAIFGPTRSFSDYRMEFFGQIDQKSVGWAVRARDDKNYHAMKFTVIQAGLRPVIAMVHYNVIDGVAGRKVQIPLNVMVHNNKPIQVAVSVTGNHLVTSVDGEAVDTFINDVLPTGGVGFFSEAGERARLYWTKVTKNDDWLGHVCAFLSGDTPVTAELWPYRTPGNPAPWAPDAGDPPALAAAWVALPYLRRTHSPRNKRCNS